MCAVFLTIEAIFDHGVSLDEYRHINTEYRISKSIHRLCCGHIIIYCFIIYLFTISSYQLYILYRMLQLDQPFIVYNPVYKCHKSVGNIKRERERASQIVVDLETRLSLPRKQPNFAFSCNQLNILGIWDGLMI